MALFLGGVLLNSHDLCKKGKSVTCKKNLQRSFSLGSQVLTDRTSRLDQMISVPSFAINAKMVEAHKGGSGTNFVISSPLSFQEMSTYY